MMIDASFDSFPEAPLDRSNDWAMALRLATLARQAMIAEAELTPKPGLVDRCSPGAHADLSLSIMRASAFAIEPYLCHMASVARQSCPSQVLRERLAAIGRDSEKAMLNATGGSNSHKGAIWSLGLLISAAAMQSHAKMMASAISKTARKVAFYEDRAAPGLASHGDLVANRYGVAGARGEALLGFPHVTRIGLPMLRKRRRSGATEQVARLDTLLSIMSRLNDTCLLYRGGMTALTAAKNGAIAVIEAGGSQTTIGMQRLASLNRNLLELKASPGGSADLLAGTLFLDAVESGQDKVQPDRSRAENVYGADEV
jgi:triphosphoribosyl-dephospho-CoA synthase